MKIAVFSAQPYDRQFLDVANAGEGHELHYFEVALGPETLALAGGFPTVCTFVNDTADASVLEALRAGGTTLVALRCTGFNNVDLVAARGHRHDQRDHPAQRVRVRPQGSSLERDQARLRALPHPRKLEKGASSASPTAIATSPDVAGPAERRDELRRQRRTTAALKAVYSGARSTCWCNTRSDRLKAAQALPEARRRPRRQARHGRQHVRHQVGRTSAVRRQLADVSADSVEVAAHLHEAVLHDCPLMARVQPLLVRGGSKVRSFCG